MSGRDPDTSSARAEADDGSAAAERVRLIFEHGVQFAGLLSADGVLLETNPASLRFVGARRSDVVGRPFWQTPWWNAEAEKERLRDAIDRAADGETVEYEFRTEDSSGQPAVLDFSLTPVPGDGGDVRAIVAEARDVTALDAAREALRTSEATRAAILSGTLDAIVSVDGDQRIRLFNQGAERIFGWSAAEVLGEPLDVLIPEHFRAAHRKDVRTFGEGPDVARGMGERGEITGRRKDGELFPAEASISRTDVGGSRMYTVVLRDITARRRTERERARLADAERRARVEVEEAVRARDDMLRVVSHDLRNPVTGVMMGAKLLRFQLEPEHPGLEILDGIELAAERQARLIRDLTDVASLEADRLPIERRPHRLSTIFRAAIRPFEATARDEGIDLDWAEGVDLPSVSVDRDRIAQVLSNLLDNAFEVTEEGGCVQVAAFPAGTHVRVEVADTGPGVPEEERAYVFERFWRGSSHSRAGTGLGLALARGIVESHGGEIFLESEVGRGTTVCFTLPIAEDAAS